jgi:hypothetical protein
MSNGSPTPTPTLSGKDLLPPLDGVNPGTGARAVDFTAADDRVITIAIRHCGSRLIRPEVV